MANVIEYNGKDKWKKKATELLNEGTGGGQVDDVKVNGTSVVDENKVAQIDLSEYATQSYVINALDDYTTTAVLQANYYNKTEVDTALLNIDVALSNRYTKSETYSQTEITDILYNYPTRNSVYTKTEADNRYVNVTGDTMTDDLYIAKDSANYKTTSEHTYIATSANNNVSTNQSSGLINRDMAGYGFGSFVTEQKTTGEIISVIEAKNVDTNADEHTNRIEVGIDKNGNNTYDVSSPSAFRSAISASPVLTYSEGSVDGAFQVMPSGGSAQSVPVHNVIRHGGTLTATQDNPIDFNDEAFRGANARHVYWIGINQYVSNAPVPNGSYGNFECYGSMQRFSRYRQTGCGQAFQRHYMNGAWSPWMRMNQDIHTIETDDMTTAVTLTSGSYGTLASVTLSAGIWQFNARASFASNATGNRAIMVTSSNTSTSSYDSMYVRVPSAGGSHTTGLCVSGCFELAKPTTLYLRGFQNSGGNLNVSSASIRAIRIA